MLQLGDQATHGQVGPLPPRQHASLRGAAHSHNHDVESHPNKACACAAAPQESSGALADRARTPGLAADAGRGACNRHRQRSDLLLRCAVRQVSPPHALPRQTCNCFELHVLCSRAALLKPCHEGRLDCIRHIQGSLCYAGSSQPDLLACFQQAVSYQWWAVQQMCWPTVPSCGARHSFPCKLPSARASPCPHRLRCMALHPCDRPRHTL